MKIASSLRLCHQMMTDKYTPLKEQVDLFFRGHKDEKWHYESRLKEQVSFALKIETGRYEKPDDLDDFLGCTLVVENAKYIGKAVDLVAKRFTLINKRPESASFTFKQSNAFPFDDLRLYVEWKDQEYTPPTGLNGLLFEVQIKTFLQHAWAIATHDLIYKSGSKDWSKERIAYQIKAMLEHAEISIEEAESLSKTPILSKQDGYTKKLNKVINLVNDYWADDQLPKDKKRLSENILNVLNSIGITPFELRELLDIEAKSGRGAKILNLSPYSIVVQTLFIQQNERIRKYLTGDNTEVKIVISAELDRTLLPEEKCTNAIFLSNTFNS